MGAVVKLRRVPNVEVAGGSLHVEESGDGLPVLLIHGSGCNIHAWGDVTVRLAASYRVLAYDRRGYGRSARTPARDYDVHVRDAAELVERLRARPVTVVGWSSGGVVALALAIRDPTAVAGLVLVEPPLHGQFHPTRSLLGLYPRMQRLVRKGRHRDASEMWLRWVTSSSAGGNSFDAQPRGLREEMLADSDTLVTEFRPALRPATGENLRRRQIAAIRCPVRCLVGGRSNPWLRQSARRLASWHPGVQLFEVPEATHSLPLEAPEELVRHVREVAGG
jgi:pimeloyl-ACP methyl ester carboxylesterase